MVRNYLFFLWLYGAMAVIGLLGLPSLLISRRATMAVIRVWARTVLWGFRVIRGVTTETRGVQYAPRGAALVAAKHQGMMDIVWPFAFFDDPCFVLKKELMMMPVLGWYAWRAHMIPVDRSAHSAALKKMVADMRDRLTESRQIIIFPEGTRTAPGADSDYKPGVAALYRDLGDTPCHLVATNSGTSWPAHGLAFRPGHVVFEFLEPIPAGLKRGPFMQVLQERIETASRALLPAPQAPRA